MTEAAYLDHINRILLGKLQQTHRWAWSNNGFSFRYRERVLESWWKTVDLGLGQAPVALLGNVLLRQYLERAALRAFEAYE